MPEKIAITMQKGGVGKTSTTVNLADALRRFGFRVLVVDLDPQANATRILQMNRSDAPTSTDLMLNADLSAQDTVTATKIPDVSLIGANIKLASIDNALRNPERYPQPIQQLQRKLDAPDLAFDFVLLDTPPSLSILTMNGLAASDHLIVPMESGSQFSFEGIEDLMDIITVVQTVRQKLNILGVLVTKHDRRQNVCRAVFSSIQDRFGKEVFTTTITASTAARKAEFSGESVIQHDRKSKAAKDYMELGKEILGRLEMNPKKQTGETTAVITTHQA